MNAKVKYDYASWLTNECNWNYKTMIRPYFNMQDAYIDKGLELVSNNTGVNGLFYVKEYDFDYKTKLTNHLHLIFDLDKYIDLSISRIIKDAFNTDLTYNYWQNNHIGKILPVNDKYQAINYMLKYFNNPRTHHNLFINP